MIRVGFIFPSSDYLYDPFRGDPHTHFQILTVLEAHFGDQVDVSLIDLRGIKREFAHYHIPECDVYLYSLYTLDLSELTSVARHLRDRFPKAIHITGGPHALVYQEESLNIFDTIIVGDGERSIVEAVGAIVNGKKPKPKYVEDKALDINQFPFPRRHFLPASTVSRKGLLKLKNKRAYDDMLSTTVIFSRGCPYTCSFCAIPSAKEYSPGIRYRKPELIEEEIRYLMREYHIGGISLLDEIAMPLKQAAVVPHLEAIGRTGIKWRGQTRVDCLTPKIAKLAKESGCVSMSLGVESASQGVLDILNKRIKVEKSKETIRLLKKNDIECRVYLMTGLPGESENVVEETINFLDETEPDLVTLSIFTVRPGTDIQQNPKKYGLKWVGSEWGDMMNLQGRYDDEEIRLTFDYEENTPWGKGFSQDQILQHFHELQAKIKERGLSSAIFKKAA